MGGANIIVIGKTEQEVRAKLSEQKRQARQMGLLDERLNHIEYDQKERLWKGYLWIHS